MFSSSCVSGRESNGYRMFRSGCVLAENQTVTEGSILSTCLAKNQTFTEYSVLAKNQTVTECSILAGCLAQN